MTKKISNKIFYSVIALTAVLGIGSMVAAYSLNNTINVEGDYINNEAEKIVSEDLELGAFPGPDVYNDINIHGKLTDGGKVTNASTTMTSALTLTAKQVCESSIITVNSAAVAGTVSAASLDITLPATSTLWTTCLFEEGAHTTFWLANLSPTAATTTQIVAGTGQDLLEPDDGSDHDVEIAGGARAKIEIWRQTGLETGTLDAYVTVTDFSAAD
ncbi:MAG: hypothetical protein U9O65_10590 [Thermotogota bacterium]|nr:hypothetical protein [Thermotogota bacterium]